MADKKKRKPNRYLVKIITGGYAYARRCELEHPPAIGVSLYKSKTSKEVIGKSRRLHLSIVFDEGKAHA